MHKRAMHIDSIDGFARKTSLTGFRYIQLRHIGNLGDELWTSIFRSLKCISCSQTVICLGPVV